MIQIDTLGREIPLDVIDDLAPNSKIEWNVAGALGDVVVRKSEYGLIMRDEWSKPLIAVGIVRRNMCTPPDIWALLCNNILKQPVMWKRARQTFDMFILTGYPHIRTTAPAEAKNVRRFLEFFGFEGTSLDDGVITYEVKS